MIWEKVKLGGADNLHVSSLDRLVRHHCSVTWRFACVADECKACERSLKAPESSWPPRALESGARPTRWRRPFDARYVDLRSTRSDRAAPSSTVWAGTR